MDVLKCQALLEAVDKGSILAASETLGYTPSGLNRMINILEEELSVKLLVRSRRGVTLTSEGRTLLPVMRQLVKCSEDLFQTSAALNGLGCGDLHIGSYYSFAANQLPRLIEKFSGQYPGIHIRIHEYGEARLLQMLDEYRLDCAFVSDLGEMDADFFTLIRDPLVAWVPEGHPLSGYLRIPIGELAEHPFISMVTERNWLIQHIFLKNGITPDISHTSQNPYTVYRMVESGLGISANNYMTGEHWAGRVKIIPLDPPQYVTFGLAVQKKWQQSLLLDRFVNFVKKKYDVR